MVMKIGFFLFIIMIVIVVIAWLLLSPLFKKINKTLLKITKNVREGKDDEI